MRYLIILFIWFCFNGGTAAQTCIPDTLRITSQAQLDSFTVLYPGCTEILGSLLIGHPQPVGSSDTIDVADLTPLQNISRVYGTLQVGTSPQLLSLAGLNTLSRVGNLKLGALPNLQALSDLSALTTVDDNLHLVALESITNYSGLGNLATVKGNLVLGRNPVSNLVGLQSVDKIGHLKLGNDEHLSSLSGLTGLDSLGGLYISGCDSLTSLVGLESATLYSSSGSGLIPLYIRDNNLLHDLSAIATMVNSPTSISIGLNESLRNLSGLENVTQVSGLTLYNQDTLDVSALQNLSTVSRSLQLADLPTTDLSPFANLHLQPGSLTLQNLPLIAALPPISVADSMYSIWLENLPALTELSALSNVRWVRSLRIFELPLIDFDDFEDLEQIVDRLKIEDCNQLLTLDFLSATNLTTLKELRLLGNDSLAVCNQEPVCRYILNNWAVIGGNALGCESSYTLRDQCAVYADNYGKLIYNVFYDLDSNGIQDVDEPPFPFGRIDVSGVLARLINAQGTGTVYLPAGDYPVSYQLNNPAWTLTTGAAATTVNFTATNDTVVLNYGLYPIAVESEQLTTLNTTPFRCNSTVRLDAATFNFGTTTTSGTLWLTTDPVSDSVYFDVPPDTLVGINQYGWHFTGMLPGQSFIVTAYAQIGGPPEIALGAPLTYTAYTDYQDIQGDQVTAIATATGPLRCSYDPNDKLVSTGFTDGILTAGSPLMYTIRFQNTGNAPAFDVSILDTLDTHLNAATLIVLATSHPAQLRTTITEERYVEFAFPDINLVDSTTSFAESQGFVTYRIHSRDDLPVGTQIENTAHIYFDQNPPIVTNTTQNTVDIDSDADGWFSLQDCDDQNATVYPGAVDIPDNSIDEDCDGFDNSTTGTKVLPRLEVRLFPNPVEDYFVLRADRSDPLTVTIMDPLGRTVRRFIAYRSEQAIPTTGLAPGLYTVRVSVANDPTVNILRFFKDS